MVCEGSGAVTGKGRLRVSGGNAGEEELNSLFI